MLRASAAAAEPLIRSMGVAANRTFAHQTLGARLRRQSQSSKPITTRPPSTISS